MKRGGNLIVQLLPTGILNETLIQIEWEDYTESVAVIHRHLEGTNSELTGCINFLTENNIEMVKSIQRIAHEIKMTGDVLIVIGVGGSFLGTKVIHDALTPYFGDRANGIEVIYVGQNMSGAYIRQLFNSLEHKDMYVNVISKSGKTMEPALAFRVFRQYMEKRYGDEAFNRIIVTTGAENGLLKKIAKK